MIQLTRFRTHVSLTSEELVPLQAQFCEEYHLRLPRLLSPDLLALSMPRLEEAQFSTNDDSIAVELRMKTNPLLSALTMAANDPAFLRIVQTITSSEPFGCFSGRVYRMTREHTGGHWHSDWSNARRIGMSINLTPDTYAGGFLQLRKKTEDRMLCEVHNTGLGDAVIFPLSEDLVHRVSDVTGPVHKTTFAGWFCATPDFWHHLPRTPGACRGKSR